MRARQISSISAAVHFVLALAAVYYTVRINNDSDLSQAAAKELVVMAGIVLLPLLYLWFGSKVAGSDASRRVLAMGQTAALVLFAATFVMVARSVEPMAPLLFVLVSIWIALGFAVLLLVAWFVGRRV